MLFFTPYDIWLIPGFLLAMYAEIKVKSTVNKYSKISLTKSLTGAEVARRILDAEGLRDVQIEKHQGFLSDHYDPTKRVLRLSPSNYAGRSITAAGISAHEAGHAVQHAHLYKPLVFRNQLVPVANLGSSLAFPLLLIGYFFNSTQFFFTGIVVFSLAVLFTLVTLPVEYDASRRALLLLTQAGIVSDTEKKGIKKVLSAAALTYLAAAIVALLQLLSLVLQYQSRD